jgi:hypothetical protein
MNQEPYTPNNQSDPAGRQDPGGSYIPPYDPYMRPAKKESSGFSLAAMILGIFSVVCCCLTPVSLICAILAIVFSIFGRRQHGFFNGMAMAGLVCGIIAFVLGVYSIISTLLNPIVLDEEFLKQYFAMIEEIMKQASEQKSAAIRFLLP